MGKKQQNTEKRNTKWQTKMTKFISWRGRWMNCPLDSRNHSFFHKLHAVKSCLVYTHYFLVKNCFHLFSSWCVLKSCQLSEQISAFLISLIKDSLMMYIIFLSRILLFCFHKIWNSKICSEVYISLGKLICTYSDPSYTEH